MNDGDRTAGQTGRLRPKTIARSPCGCRCRREGTGEIPGL
jgi:hypothetical protein